MTEFVDVAGGRIAFDVDGSGPLVVLSPGIGVRRQDCRFVAPMLAQAGYRVATADLRGHGESSLGWPSITRTDIAGYLLALIGRLDGPAVIVGHSISGGAATIAAATRPEQVSGIVEINPFTRKVQYSLGGPRAEGDAIVAAMPAGAATTGLLTERPASPSLSKQPREESTEVNAHRRSGPMREDGG